MLSAPGLPAFAVICDSIHQKFFLDIRQRIFRMWGSVSVMRTIPVSDYHLQSSLFTLELKSVYNISVQKAEITVAY